MELRVLDGTYALCRLDGGSALPSWFAFDPPLAAAVRRGEDELSLVVAGERVPAGVAAERGFRALEVQGPLDLAMTGVMADLSGALARAGVPIMPLATYDTDVILVHDDRLADATAALRAAGHTVEA
ncbi:MAG: ACT domain-containing protein [Actinomycetota bacterium]|nr:ACT domain-containing protein [Actinomycetota bacterium]